MTNTQQNSDISNISSEKKLLDLTPNSPHQNEGPLEHVTSQKISKLTVIFISLTILLFGLSAFLTYRLFQTKEKINSIEELTIKNSRQLMNLNEMLGTSLDLPKDQVESLPALSMKHSLEFFKHIHQLTQDVEGLSFPPNKANLPTDKKNPISQLREEKKHTSKFRNTLVGNPY
jgi:hypothetical protein